MFKLGKIPGTDGRYKACCRQFTEKGAEQIAFGAAQIGGKGAFVGIPRDFGRLNFAGQQRIKHRFQFLLQIFA